MFRRKKVPEPEARMCVVRESGPCPFTAKRSVAFDVNMGEPATLDLCAWHANKLTERMSSRRKQGL